MTRARSHFFEIPIYSGPPDTLEDAFAYEGGPASYWSQRTITALGEPSASTPGKVNAKSRCTPPTLTMVA